MSTDGYGLKGKNKMQDAIRTVYKTKSNSIKITSIIVIKESKNRIWFFAKNGNTESMRKESKSHVIHDTFWQAKDHLLKHFTAKKDNALEAYRDYCESFVDVSLLKDPEEKDGGNDQKNV